jgi:predicted NAD/FAD-dependent oxidoreductase
VGADGVIKAIRSAIVLGAGIAGLACAGELVQAGVAVTLLDKGRRPGGRVATRRTDGLTFNHGAQFATVHGVGFRRLLTDLQASGCAAPWPEAGPGRFVFLPGMSALPASMAKLVSTFHTGRHAAFLRRDPAGWIVRHFPATDMRPGETAPSGGDLSDPHDAVLIAVPAPQAAALLDTAAHAFAAMARQAVMAPCWTVMARFASPVTSNDVLERQTGAIAWAAREPSRPGRSGEPEAWTLQAGADWSRAHLEDSADAVCRALLTVFRGMTGSPEATAVQAHRWRHAKVEIPLGQPCLWDHDARVGVCGDWCLSARIEAAYDSGISLAANVLA